MPIRGFRWPKVKRTRSYSISKGPELEVISSCRHPKTVLTNMCSKEHSHTWKLITP